MYYSTPSVTSGCTAHVTKNRNRSKIYENSVYLKDGENFEIELFNPTTARVLARIQINGNSISSSGIVLRPGERVYLERFIDSNNKFVFETYQVEDSKETKNATRNNGSLEVNFYLEVTNNSTNTYLGGHIGSTAGNYFGGSTLTYTTGTPICYLNQNVSFGGTTQNNLFTSDSSVGANSSIPASRSKSVETGRIEKGDSSKQSLETVNGNFGYFPSSTISIKLLPESQKPLESSSIRNYCTNCGTRMKKSSWKFCPSCGSKI
jgi:hypothetical protein